DLTARAALLGKTESAADPSQHVLIAGQALLDPGLKRNVGPVIPARDQPWKRRDRSLDREHVEAGLDRLVGLVRERLLDDSHDLASDDARRAGDSAHLRAERKVLDDQLDLSRRERAQRALVLPAILADDLGESEGVECRRGGGPCEREWVELHLTR